MCVFVKTILSGVPLQTPHTPLTGVAQIAEIATPKNAIESVIRSWGDGAT